MIAANSPQFRVAEPAEDEIIAQHFYQLWRDNQIAVAEIESNWQAITVEFIQQARENLSYQAFVATVEGQIVGSAGCQLFSGLYPLVLTAKQRRYGYLWGVYVEPSHRRRGIAKTLTQLAIDQLKTLGCTRVILHASPSGQWVYQQLGFSESNEMRLDLS